MDLSINNAEAVLENFKAAVNQMPQSDRVYYNNVFRHLATSLEERQSQGSREEELNSQEAASKSTSPSMIPASASECASNWPISGPTSVSELCFWFSSGIGLPPWHTMSVTPSVSGSASIGVVEVSRSPLIPSSFSLAGVEICTGFPFAQSQIKKWIHYDRQRRRLKHFVNSYPAIHQVAEKAAPTAAQWSEKYNHTVKDLTQKGYAVFGYLPLVPVDMR
ncbi:hypothetical protein F8388_023218 [Cannabis sativa]|uniref:Uncharacterized protein n=1 Tax=Cannabis sativa TaxID=3483 RepID=A0A7J6HDR5_CANSA|nr:hypothetical protein F8388_023218 [Cannabis sativa]KAF4396618.1 hypothetical protein G4B88_028932 [Cannabis sativa]KAF4396629.1 hypothetical protein G4B88_028943 [Cannabis sativa]